MYSLLPVDSNTGVSRDPMSKQNKKGAAAPTKTRKAQGPKGPERKSASAKAVAPKRGRSVGQPRPSPQVKGLKNGSGGRVGVSSRPMHFHGGDHRAFGDQRRFTDCIFIEVVTAPATFPSGTILWSRKNRCSIPGTYLEVYAGLYNRWRIHKWRYVFTPVPGSTFANQVLMATDPDPLSVYDDVTTNIQRLSILEGSQIEQLWLGLSCSYPTKSKTKNSDLWTKDLDPSVADYADRFSIAGNSFLVNVATGDMVAGSEIGSIKLELDVEFYDPKLSLSSLTSGLFINLSEPDGGNPFINSDGATSVGVIKTVMDVIIALAAIGTSPGAWEILTEAVNSYFDYVPYILEAPTPENKGRHIIDKSPRRRAAHLGAAPSELPGFAPGHYSAKVTFFTATTMADVLSNYGYQSGGSIISFQASVDLEENVVTTNGYRNPISGNLFNCKTTLFCEFAVKTSRGYGDMRIVNVDTGYGPTAGDECIIEFTRNCPHKYVYGTTGIEGLRGATTDVSKRPDAIAFRHFMKMYDSMRSPPAKKTTDDLKRFPDPRPRAEVPDARRRGITFGEFKELAGAAAPPAPRTDRESKIPPDASRVAPTKSSDGSQRDTRHDVSVADGEWHFIPRDDAAKARTEAIARAHSSVDPDPPAPSAAAVAALSSGQRYSVNPEMARAAAAFPLTRT